MAAYAATVSLLKILPQLKHTLSSQQIAILRRGLESLKHFLADNREIKRAFETQIRDAIYEAEDIVASLLSSAQFVSPSEADISSQSFFADLERVTQNINSIAEMTTEEFDYFNHRIASLLSSAHVVAPSEAEMISQSFSTELESVIVKIKLIAETTTEELSHQTLDRKISNSIWKKSDDIYCRKKCTMRGRLEDLNQLRNRVLRGPESLEVVPIVGIAGIGKTTVATYLYRHDEYFCVSAWVKVPIEYNKRDLLLRLLRSMKKLGDEVSQMTEKQLKKYLHNFLKRGRYLIVLDDIRQVNVWDDLKKLFPDYSDASRIVLTTRNADVACVAGTPHLLRRISDEDTLAVLEEIVFGDDPCPLEFVAVSKDIVESCRGLPLAVVIVGRLLGCAKLSTEYWEIVSSSIKNMPSLSGDYYVNLVEALVSITYKHLPQQLKPYFLYMAMFPYDYEIPIFKLRNLLVAEGFMIDKYIGSALEICVFDDCFYQLYDRALIHGTIMELQMKACRISEEAFHDFLLRTAMEEKFFIVINKDTNYKDFLEEECSTSHKQRRLCIQKNIVPFIIKDLPKYSSLKTSISTLFSLLYFGPEHHYPMPAWLEDFKLLRVLEASRIRFHYFPVQILELTELRYIALSYNRELPAAVCKLRNLQVLIILRDLGLTCSGAPVYLPVEIWNMEELSYLQVVGGELPEPPSNSEGLYNLLEISGMSARNCTPRILEKIPNLVRLEILVESLPEDGSLSCFSHLHVIKHNISFKCVVMYPDSGPQVAPCSTPAFSSSLTILSLSGCGFPWEYITVIATLSNLKQLELQSYAFKGPMWEVKKDEFTNLGSLLLGDMDLKDLELADESCFPELIYLIIRHCYKLREIPSAFADRPLLTLEVVECSTGAMDSALKIQKLKREDRTIEFNLYSSRDD